MPLTVPLVMPPPVQPVNAPAVVVTGNTFWSELVGGRPGLYDCVPENSLHFGTTVLTAPAGPAVSTPTGRHSEITNKSPRPLRMRFSFVDQARTTGAPLPLGGGRSNYRDFP